MIFRRQRETGEIRHSSVYRGTVMHRRLKPFVHHFVYRVFTFYLDLAELTALSRRLTLFSHNRWNVFSFWDKDHGPRDGSPLRPWALSQLKAAGIDLNGGSIRLICFPRLFGFAFNPLSIWFCRHGDGRLAALIYEVRNTFGEAHSYLIPIEAAETAAGALAHSCDKNFYVSPFLPMACRYHFRIAPPDDKFALLIRQTTAEGHVLLARQLGKRVSLSNRASVKLLLAHPLMTMKVIAGIHWEALHLWRRGARFHSRPPAPARLVTAVHPRNSGAPQGVAPL